MNCPNCKLPVLVDEWGILCKVCGRFEPTPDGGYKPSEFIPAGVQTPPDSTSEHTGGNAGLRTATPTTLIRISIFDGDEL